MYHNVQFNGYNVIVKRPASGQQHLGDHIWNRWLGTAVKGQDTQLYGQNPPSYDTLSTGCLKGYSTDQVTLNVELNFIW